MNYLVSALASSAQATGRNHSRATREHGSVWACLCWSVWRQIVRLKTVDQEAQIPLLFPNHQTTLTAMRLRHTLLASSPAQHPQARKPPWSWFRKQLRSPHQAAYRKTDHLHSSLFCKIWNKLLVTSPGLSTLAETGSSSTLHSHLGLPLLSLI